MIGQDDAVRDFRLTDAFVRSKVGKPELCEDVYAEGADFLVVADGATDKSGLRFRGLTGGRRVAELVVRVVAAAPRGMSGSDLVDAINRAYAEELGPTLEQVPAADHPQASFCAFEKRTGRVLRVGDVTWQTPARTVSGRSTAEVRLAVARATFLRLLLLAGEDEATLRAKDPGRAMILPALRALAAARNLCAEDELATATIDGRAVPDKLIEEWLLTPAERSIVITTDGYPRPSMILERVEAELGTDLAADPLRIGAHPATKAVRPGDESFDDRTFVRLDEVSG